MSEATRRPEGRLLGPGDGNPQTHLSAPFARLAGKPPVHRFSMSMQDQFGGSGAPVTWELELTARGFRVRRSFLKLRGENLTGRSVVLGSLKVWRLAASERLIGPPGRFRKRMAAGRRRARVRPDAKARARIAAQRQNRWRHNEWAGSEGSGRTYGTRRARGALQYQDDADNGQHGL
jgi:hypothetical protein